MDLIHCGTRHGICHVRTDIERVIFYLTQVKKSRIRETKHLSTNTDTSTDAIGGWTKNTQKSDLFDQRKKITKNAKTQNCLEI